MRTFIVLGLMSLTCLYAEDSSKVTAENLKPLQGKWIAQSFKSKNGKQDGGKGMIEIVGDEVSSSAPNATPTKTTIVAIEDTTDPKRIDLRFTTDIGEITSQAIFKIEGDVLTICSYDGNGDHRPKEFIAQDDRVHVAIYKRHRE